MGPPRKTGRKALSRDRDRGAGPGSGSGSYSPEVEAILAVLRSIPRGKAASYGQVARLAGQPRGARQVARMLHALSEKQGLPWHRVINSQGRISLPMEGPGGLQARLLRKEGVEVDMRGRVDMRRHGWTPRPQPRPQRRVQP